MSINNKTVNAIIFSLTYFACTQTVLADPIVLPHTFVDGTVSDADEVNANFDAIAAHLANTAHVDAVSGNFGIGTDSPEAQLEVHGNVLLGANNVNAVIHGGRHAAFTADANLVFAADSNAESGANGIIIFGSGSAHNTDAERTFSFDDAFPNGTPSQEHMRITAQGNVGIGTTNPLAKLDVNGKITGNVITIDGARGVHSGQDADTELLLQGAHPQIKFHTNSISHNDWWIGTDGDNLKIRSDHDPSQVGNWDNRSMTITPFGFVGIINQYPTVALDVNGEIKAKAVDVNGEITATVMNITSDKNAKEDFSSVDSGEVLAKVIDMPISRWQFKAHPGVRHIGPMAQDFHAAFAVGRDDKHISSVDSDGVALAAIQGMHAIIQEQRAQLSGLREELAKLTKRMNRLERTNLADAARLGHGDSQP